MRRRVAQGAPADVGRFDHEMGGHREIAEQALARFDVRMLGDEHLAKAPHRDVAEAGGRRKQLPVFQLIAENRIGDVVGGEGEAIDPQQQRFGRQRIGIGQMQLDGPALLQIVARDDEVGGGHGFGPGFCPAASFAFVDDGFATPTLFETLFACGAVPITPSRFFIAR